MARVRRAGCVGGRPRPRRRSEAENPWFARSAEYAGLNPAPFFFDETVLAPGDTLVLAAAFVVGGADVARFASSTGANLVAELRAQPLPADRIRRTDRRESDR